MVWKWPGTRPSALQAEEFPGTALQASPLLCWTRISARGVTEVHEMSNTDSVSFHLFTFHGLLHVLNGFIQKLIQTEMTWSDNSSI